MTKSLRHNASNLLGIPSVRIYWVNFKNEKCDMSFLVPLMNSSLLKKKNMRVKCALDIAFRGKVGKSLRKEF